MTIKGCAFPGLSFHFSRDSVYNSNEAVHGTLATGTEAGPQSTGRAGVPAGYALDRTSDVIERFALEQSQEFESVTACDLCFGRDHDLLFLKEGFRHVRCRSCGLVFVSPRLARHLEIQTDSGTGCMGEDSLTLAQENRLRKEVAAIEPFRRLNRMLEVGAGRGWFLSVAAQSGWETWAVEINRDAVQHLRSKGIHRIIVDTAEDFDASAGSMDVVKMWDVIEHLQSPRKALTNIHRVLRPGGLLRLATTNFASLSRWINGPEWVYLNGADHIFLFDPSTISRLLSAMRVLRHSYPDQVLQPEEETLPPGDGLACEVLFLATVQKAHRCCGGYYYVWPPDDRDCH